MDSKSVESKFNANCHFFSVKLDCVKNKTNIVISQKKPKSKFNINSMILYVPFPKRFESGAVHFA